MSLYVGPGGSERLGDILRRELSGSWNRFRFATAYVRVSGVEHLHDLLEVFASAPGHVLRATVGIDQHGTSYEALATLLDIFGRNGHELFVCHNPRSKGLVASPTFHPKIWLFDNGRNAKLLTGSGNLTQGGLYTNHEVGTVQSLDMNNPSDRQIFDQAVSVLDRWADLSKGDVRRLDANLLDQLYDANLVLSEDEMRRASRVSARVRLVSAGKESIASVGGTIFRGEEFEMPPTPPRGRRPRTRVVARRPNAGGAAERQPVPSLPQHRVFYINLSTASKTEIYLAQAPLREDPAFFGLPFTGRTEPRNRNNPPQPQANPWPICDVTIYDAHGIAASRGELPTKMWQYMAGPNANGDVRIYFTADLHRQIADGSVCVIERDPRPGVDYAISIYPPDHPDFPQYDARCTQQLPNSQRRYGWS